MSLISSKFIVIEPILMRIDVDGVSVAWNRFAECA